MKILKFEEHFPDEESCIIFFKAKREHKGVICKKCKGKDATNSTEDTLEKGNLIDLSLLLFSPTGKEADNHKTLFLLRF